MTELCPLIINKPIKVDLPTYVVMAISISEMECKTTSTGTEYKGSLNVTITGRTCQRWNTNTPHYIFEANRMTEDDKNYCRNPDNENGGPWCHTTDPGMRWEYCNVAMCTCVHSNK